MLNIYTSFNAGHLNIVKLLIDYDANINLPNKIGTTPIAVAAYQGEWNSIIYGILTENLLKKTKTYWIFSIYLGFDEIMELLIHNKAHVDLGHHVVKSALDMARCRGDYIAFFKNSWQFLKIMLFFFCKGEVKIVQSLLEAAKGNPFVI